MRAVLDTVIHANRAAQRPVADVPHLERVRRQFGQLHRGTYRPCTQSPPAYCPWTAFRLVRDVLAVVPLGHPQAGALYRLAADLADQIAQPTVAPID
jgi:hypothetical protein